MSIAPYQGVDGYVGNTPLIRLRRLSELTGCEILGKAEFMNPGGSVKDRAAYGIIQPGLLKPGATIRRQLFIHTHNKAPRFPRDVRQQERLFARWNPRLRRSPDSNRLC